MTCARAARCLVALAVLSSTPVAAEVESASASGFVVTNVEVVPVDAAAAWQALVGAVNTWWPRDHTWWGEASALSIEPRAGGCFCEIDGERQARHMTIAFVDPPHVLRMLGGLGPLQGMGLHGALEWRLDAEEEGTRLLLRYQVGGYAPDDLSQLAPIVDRVQAAQLGALAGHLRGAAASSATAERPE